MNFPEVKEQDGRTAVSAIDLYDFLGLNKTHRKRWFNKNIVNNVYAAEGSDYVGVAIMANGNPVVDFAISIDFAKKLSMKVDTDKGEKIRAYFLQMEKIVKDEASATPSPLNEDEKITEAFQILLNRVERSEAKIKLQAEEIKKATPKVQYHDEVLQSNSTYNTNQIAKELGMSARGLNQILATNKVQYYQSKTWLLYSKYQNKGYTKTKTYTYNNSEGESHTNMQTVWTEKGRKFIHELLQEPSNAVVVSHFQKKRAS